MSYAVVIVYIEANGLPERRVRLAAGLAGKFNAILAGISAVAIHPPYLYEGAVIQQVNEAEIADAMKKLDAKEDWFRKIAGAHHPKLEWRPVIDYPIDALAREARSADLVIIGKTKSQGDSFASLDPGEALLKLGRPVLLVPEGMDSLRAEHVVIGWKDARESRRALGDALPFLHEASRVTVAEIYEAGEETAAKQGIEDVVRYLARHRIDATGRPVLRGDKAGAGQLIALAQAEGADLIVSGAYGHSRLGEWVFGGVTQDLLAASSICCFMSH
jgi:nucleotide-binding universal stress UspA family protein